MKPPAKSARFLKREVSPSGKNSSKQSLIKKRKLTCINHSKWPKCQLFYTADIWVFSPVLSMLAYCELGANWFFIGWRNISLNVILNCLDMVQYRIKLIPEFVKAMISITSPGNRIIIKWVGKQGLNYKIINPLIVSTFCLKPPQQLGKLIPTVENYDRYYR